MTADPPGFATRIWDGAAAAPLRAVGLVAILLVAGGLTVQSLRPSELTPEAIRAAAVEMDLAATLWLDGHFEPARDAVRRSLKENPRNVSAVALALHLSNGAGRSSRSAVSDSIRLALDAYATRNYDLALARLNRIPSPEREAPLLVAVAALCAAESDGEDAEAAGLEAADRLPDSVTLQRNLAEIYQRIGQNDRAEIVFRRITTMEPDSVRSWRDLAGALHRQRKIEESESAVLRALEIKNDDPASLRTLATLRIMSDRGSEGREILRRLIESDAGNPSLWYELGYSLDLDHDIVEAEKAYRQAVVLKPDHGRALLCLANLHAGASRGDCRQCDEVFAAHPECLDLGKAEEYLLRNLEVDRGLDTWAIKSALAISLKLSSRARVAALLEELTDGAEKTPGVVRMEELLARIRLMDR